MKTKTFWIILAVIVAVRLVLMAVVPVFEPSEARYAAIASNMARSGDFVVPHFTYDLEYQSFDGKPPLVFQAGGLFCQALGMDSPWRLQLAVRLFPFLSAALLLLIVYLTVKRFADAEAGRLAVLVTATCTAFFAAAGISMTDMSLTCCVAGALLLYECFARGETGRLRYAAGVAALLGAGMIVKGPVAFVMFGLPVFVDACVNRRWRAVFNVRWLVVLPIFLAIAVPWFVLVEQRNPGSVWYFFYNENFMRFISHDYGDKYGAGREAFRGVSVLWAFVATLPWALAVGLRGLRRLRGLRGFPFLAMVSIISFWCLTSRVLLYYLFPVIPLFSVWLVREGDRSWITRLAVPCAALTAVVCTCVLLGGMFFSDKMLGPRTPFEPHRNHYAYEFYHGRKPEAELAKWRAVLEEMKAKRRKVPIDQRTGTSVVPKEAK